jgi:hypothetical protein
MQAGDIELIGKTADLIVKYGFLGVGLVLTVLIAPFVNKVWKSKTLTLTVASFGIAFIVAWGVLDIVQRYFPSLISSERVLLKGIVLGVPNGFQVQVASNLRKAGTAYIKRENHPENRELSNFIFLLVSSQSPSCLSVAINSNDPRSEAGSSGFHIAPISSDDFKSNADLILMTRRAGAKFRLRVWREAGERQIGRATDFEPLGDDVPGCSIGQNASILDWISPRAFAQLPAPSNMQDLSVRLRSDDLFTRRNARIELSKQGSQTIEFVREFLGSDNYRLQLGALVALSIMSEEDRKRLPPDVLAKVRSFTANSDPTIRETASRIVQP